MGNEENSSILSESDLHDIQDIVVDSSSSASHFDKLGHDVTRKIVEHLIDDFASIRLVCKIFRRSFDDVNFAICSLLIPGFTKSTFSHWNNTNPTRNYLKYQLIVLTNLILFDSNQKACNCADFNTSLELTTDFHLRHNAIDLIKFFETENIDMCLKLANAFLKLRIVAWSDIYKLLFSNTPKNISKAWSLGLTTIARLMAFYNQDKFIMSIKFVTDGLLIPIKARKYALSRFMITYKIRHGFYYSRSEIPVLLKELISAEYWDLLQEVYKINDKLVLLAASNCHLNDLRELDALGYLEINSPLHVEEYHSAICRAASNGHTGCLEFLVSRLGKNYLDLMDKWQYMPIHHAAKSNNPETLIAIIRLYPSYKSIRSDCFGRVSPLKMALLWGLPTNAKIIIKSFPELIDFDFQNPNEATNVFNSATNPKNIDILKFLLKNAKPETITAKTKSGSTALHRAAVHRNCVEVIQILLKTDLFNVMEQNNSGKTAVAIFQSYNRLATRPEMMKIFNLETEEQLTDALTVRTLRRAIM